MSRLLPLIYLLVLALSATACTEDFFVDTEPLERELLGVWIAAERDDITVLNAYNAEAQDRWQGNRERFADSSLSPAERGALRLTDRWMRELDVAVTTGDLPRVRYQLRELRAAVRELRGPVVADHPADLLYAFDEQWGWVSDISHDQMMCLVEWSEYEDAYREARSTWRRFGGLPLVSHRDLFPGYGDNAGAVEFSRTELDREFAEFERLLERGNHSLTTRTTEEIERRFFDHLALLIGYPVAVEAF